MIRIWVITSLTIALNTISLDTKAQILDSSLFKIYRSEFILGTVTELRFDSDSTYQIKVAEIHCSLCDHDELRKAINTNGKWKQSNDTIYLENTNRLLISGDSVIKPLYLIGINTDSITEIQESNLKQISVKNKSNEFHLVYDTYSNGIAKLIIDRYRMRRNEYEIEILPNGAVKAIRYYWDNKQRKKIR